MTRLLAKLCLGVLVMTASTRAHAQDVELSQAKDYFKAGAAAYEVGDYLAAIQALDAAYRSSPLPAIAFSLAQAERRQYFVSREPAHLDRAIQLFRSYLQQINRGGRRADAIDALGQLEPLAVNSGGALVDNTGVQPAPPVEKTRLMISCVVPGASISLDGAPAAPSPLIAQVTTGPHRVLVSAAGFVASERNVTAVPGELLPVEVSLREKPAFVFVHANMDAQLHLDGVSIGKLGPGRHLELPSGAHEFSFAKNGYHLETVRARLAPGADEKITAKLRQTGQRTSALVLFFASAAGLATASILSALAADRESAAGRILDRRATTSISSQERSDYTDATQDRDRWRLAAVATFAVSAASLVTGLFLYALDQPDTKESVGSRAASLGSQIRIRLPVPGGQHALGVDLVRRF